MDPRANGTPDPVSHSSSQRMSFWSPCPTQGAQKAWGHTGIVTFRELRDRETMRETAVLSNQLKTRLSIILELDGLRERYGASDGSYYFRARGTYDETDHLFWYSVVRSLFTAFKPGSYAGCRQTGGSSTERSVLPGTTALEPGRWHGRAES